MVIYNVELYTDMGNLMNTPQNLPKHIHDFVYNKAKQYLNYATDNDGLGCRFYILKPGVQTTWTYNYGSDTIKITYNVNTFNAKTMKML